MNNITLKQKHDYKKIWVNYDDLKDVLKYGLSIMNIDGFMFMGKSCWLIEFKRKSESFDPQSIIEGAIDGQFGVLTGMIDSLKTIDSNKRHFYQYIIADTDENGNIIGECTSHIFHKNPESNKIEWKQYNHSSPNDLYDLIIKMRKKTQDEVYDCGDTEDFYPVNQLSNTEPSIENLNAKCGTYFLPVTGATLHRLLKEKHFFMLYVYPVKDKIESDDYITNIYRNMTYHYFKKLLKYSVASKSKIFIMTTDTVSDVKDLKDYNIFDIIQVKPQVTEPYGYLKDFFGKWHKSLDEKNNKMIAENEGDWPRYCMDDIKSIKKQGLTLPF